MTTIINASASSGLVQTADTSTILQLQTASTAALTIDASQNVGIGTASPTTKTQVSATTGGSATGLSVVASGNMLNIFGSSSTNAGVILDATNGTAGSATAVPTIFRYGGTESMRINSSGNVGIGTTSPTAKLTVSTNASNEGEIRISDNATYYAGLSRVNATDEFRIGSYGTAQNITFYTVASERMRITSDGNLNVNRQITSFTTNGFGVFGATNTVTVADGATITLSGGSSSQLISLTCASTGTGGAFFANYNTTVSQIGGSSTSISTTDAGTVDIAIYKSASSNTVTFKNRSGQSKVYRIAMFCGENGGTV